MKQKTIFVLLALIISTKSYASPLDDYFQQFRNRIEQEIKEFVLVSGWSSNFRGLSPASSLGVWGFDVGVELTSLPQNAFHLAGQDLSLPSFFPRVTLAKGITPNLDFQSSFLFPQILQGRVDLPEEIKKLIIYGGGLKYTLFHEEESWVSVAARVSYTRLYLDFFSNEVFGADASLSRSLKIPFTPFQLTPYLGGGYIGTKGEFKTTFIPFVTTGKHTAEAYRMFGGASLKLFFLDFTGQVDQSSSRRFSPIKTYSIKTSINVTSF